MKQIINKLLAVVLFALAIVMLYSIVLGGHTAQANNGDIDLIERSGSSNTPTTDLINTSGSNGDAVTNGNGLTISPCGPIVSSTGNLNTTGTLPGTTGTAPIVGQLGLSSSGTLVIYGTNGVWRNAP